MNKKPIKKIIFLAVMVMTYMTTLLIPQIVKASNNEELCCNDFAVSNNIALEIISYDEENKRSLAVVSISPASMNASPGTIIADGVRLRTNPSMSAAILELMYVGEKVWINKNQDNITDSSWIYVQRIKTGTCGWVYSNYVSE